MYASYASIVHQLSTLLKMQRVFRYVATSQVQFITSSITITEVLAKPIKLANLQVQKRYRDLFSKTRNVRSVYVNNQIADLAAQLRAKYNLRTPDALQIATGIHTNCDVFLTNDISLARVGEIRVLIFDELEL